VSRLQHKALAKPDDVRRMPHGRVQVTSLDEWTVLELTMEPGWRWSNDVQPIAGTASCQQRHLGVMLSGRIHVETDAGVVDEF
jgi:hypothetical protein